MVDAAQNRKWVWVIGPPSLLVTSIQTAKRHENFRTLIYEEWKKPGIQAQVDNSGRSGSGGGKANVQPYGLFFPLCHHNLAPHVTPST